MSSIDVGGIHGDGNINNIGDNKIDGGQSVVNNNDAVITKEQAVVDVVQECIALAEPMGDEPIPMNIPEGASTVPLGTFNNDLSDHPTAVMDQVQRYGTMSPEALAELPEEESESFIANFKSMLVKCAPVAKKGFFGSCGVALKVLGAVSGPAWPYNALIGLLEGVIENFGGGGKS